MEPFWHFARRMLRYRWSVVASLAMAAVSAGSMGAGIVGLAPVLSIVLGGKEGRQQSLQQIVAEKPDLLAWIPSWFFDRLPTTPWSTVLSVLALLGVLTVVGGAANFAHQFLSLTVIQRTMAHIRREAFHRVLRFPLKTVVGLGPTEATSRVLVDSANLEIGLTSLLSKAISQMLKGVAAFMAAIALEWRITLGAIVLAPVLYTILRRAGKKIRRASRSALQAQSELYATSVAAMQGLRVVKSMAAERFEAGRFHAINKQVMRDMFRARTAKALASPLVEVIALFVLGAVALIPIKMVIDRQLEPQNFLLALGALGAAGAALKPLTSFVTDLQQASAAASRLQELLASPAEPGHDARLPRMPEHRERIEFQSVSLVYPGRDVPALDGISLSIKFGERVAFVGPNGSGKTTLLSLVPRLFDPDAGSILIDGRDIREFSVRSVRRRIGVVTQETVIFKDTIRKNIAYGADDRSGGAIEAAATRARAMEFIRALPHGLDTTVGEQGATLSGGQRQRLAIARAILRDPSILILDEATSMIDAESEAAIAEAIQEFSKGRTCLIVAHRLSTVLSADRIVVLDAGRVIDQGRHDELLKRCELYRRLASTQMLGGDLPIASSLEISRA